MTKYGTIPIFVVLSCLILVNGCKDKELESALADAQQLNAEMAKAIAELEKLKPIVKKYREHNEELVLKLQTVEKERNDLQLAEEWG